MTNKNKLIGLAGVLVIVGAGYAAVSNIDLMDIESLTAHVVAVQPAELAPEASLQATSSQSGAGKQPIEKNELTLSGDSVIPDTGYAVESLSLAAKAKALQSEVERTFAPGAAVTGAGTATVIGTMSSPEKNQAQVADKDELTAKQITGNSGSFLSAIFPSIAKTSVSAKSKVPSQTAVVSLARDPNADLPVQITDSRPSIAQLPEQERPTTAPNSKIVFTNPSPMLGYTTSYTNSANTVVSGTVVLTKNLDNVTVNGKAVSWLSGTFTANTPLQQGFNTITAVADYGRQSYTAEMGVILDTDKPAVISAGSTTNTEILVSFSEPMRGGMNGVENPSYYRVTDSIFIESNAQVHIQAAELILPERRTVRLTTLSQSDIQYNLTVTNVTDLAGNTIPQLEGGIQTVDHSTAVFQGMPPRGDTIDTDEDGLSDHDEQAGWSVVVVRANGETESTHITSDPFLKDTDADGVTDNEESQGGLNPRSADTDGDTLSDDLEWNTVFSDGLNQDSDGDGVQDGFEYYTFRTSPILADTDGDQISDPEEVSAGNRNPLIADLPSPRISIGNVNLQLDTRFTFTNEQGQTDSSEQTSDATLTRAENDTFSTSNVNSTKSILESTLEINNKAGAAGPVPSVEFERNLALKQGSERGNTFTAGEESGRSSEEAYHDSLTTSAAFDIRETVTREIEGAAIKVGVSVDNTGDIPFTITNLELTAQTQDPLDRRRMIPVASLVPENDSLGSINIGALGDPTRGPFVFDTVSVFPQQVQELMKNPRGLVVQLANFDITDDLGRNFAFSSKDVLDRTAGITFDLGDGRVENYRVATASAHDRDTGKPLGITMEYALSIIGLQRYRHIVDGGNGVLDTFADENDLSLAKNFDGSDSEVGDSVEPGRVLITTGSDGLLQTLTVGGDDTFADPDYETTSQPGFPYIIDGGNGVVETRSAASDQQVVTDIGPEGAYSNQITPGGAIVFVGVDSTLETTPNHLDGSAQLVGDDVLIPAQAERSLLTRYRDVKTENDAQSRFWVLISPGSRPGVDLDDLVIRAGEQYDFVFAQDNDRDNVLARVEYLHGSSDLLANTDGCLDDIAGPGFEEVCDTLTDKQEIQDGWRVKLKKSPQSYPVISNPSQADSDRDRLFDHEEKACGLDPRQRDTDLDGLTDWEEMHGRLLEGGTIDDLGYIDGLMVSRNPITNEIIDLITPYSSELGIPELGGLVNHEANDACSAILNIDGFATNPLDADTDNDLISDAIELKLGLNPNDGKDGDDFLDDDGDGRPNKSEKDGFSTIINGVASLANLTSNPNLADSDNDLLPDLLEYYLQSNPRSVDTDEDGITDTNEYKGRGAACVTNGVGLPCVQFNDSPTQFNLQNYLFACNFAAACNHTAIENNLANAFARDYGTNINEKDSDFDGLDDRDELFKNLNIVVNSGFEIVPAPSSDPLKVDTDNDGIPDSVEVSVTEGRSTACFSTNVTDPFCSICYENPKQPGKCYVTNPRNIDTDGDGRSDLSEINIGTDPNLEDLPGKLVRFSYTSIVGHESCGDNGDSLEVQATYKIISILEGIVSPTTVISMDNCDVHENGITNILASPTSGCTVTSDATKTYSLNPGDSVQMTTSGNDFQECDGTSCDTGADDDDLSPGVDETFTYEDISDTPETKTIQHCDGDCVDNLCLTTTLRVIVLTP
jgi:hypothetical protein